MTPSEPSRLSEPLGDCRLGERRLVDLMQLLSQRAGRSQTVGLQFESDLPLNSALTRVRLQWMSTLAGSTSFTCRQPGQ